MKKRLLTAALLAVLYLGLIIPSIATEYTVFYDVLVLIFMFTAAYEMMQVIEHRFSKPIKPCIYIQVVISYIAFRVANWYGEGNWGISSSFASLLIMVLVCFVYIMISKRYTMANILSTIFVSIYPLSLLSYLLAVNYVGDAYRAVGIVMVFGGTSLVDSMALFVGSVFKGKKLAPNVSPNKTVSGAIGGLFGGIMAGLIVYCLARENLLGMQLFMQTPLHNVLAFAGLGLGVSISCQAGDLIASYIKRFCAVKDYSNILPGHGGFMDRIDGVLVAGIFVFAFFAIFKVL